MLRCDECGFMFDQKDKRCSLSTDERYPNLCPACALMSYRGSTAWAIHNDCQGVFTMAVHSTREAALKELGEPGWNGCVVAPVRIYVEPKDRWPYREWCEASGH